MVWNVVSRLVTIATAAWLLLGSTPIGRDATLALAGVLLLVVIVDVLELTPTGDNTQI